MIRVCETNPWILSSHVSDFVRVTDKKQPRTSFFLLDFLIQSFGLNDMKSATARCRGEDVITLIQNLGAFDASANRGDRKNNS
jgi:hypothetical protein